MNDGPTHWNYSGLRCAGRIDSSYADQCTPLILQSIQQLARLIWLGRCLILPLDDVQHEAPSSIDIIWLSPLDRLWRQSELVSIGNRIYEANHGDHGKVRDTSGFWFSQQEFSIIHLACMSDHSRFVIDGASIFVSCLRERLDSSEDAPAMIVGQLPCMQGSSLDEVNITSPGELEDLINTMLIQLKLRSAKQIIQANDDRQCRNHDMICLE